MSCRESRHEIGVSRANIPSAPADRIHGFKGKLNPGIYYEYYLDQMNCSDRESESSYLMEIAGFVIFVLSAVDFQQKVGSHQQTANCLRNYYSACATVGTS